MANLTRGTLLSWKLQALQKVFFKLCFKAPLTVVLILTENSENFINYKTHNKKGAILKVPCMQTQN